MTSDQAGRGCERCLGLEESCMILEDMRKNTESEEWAVPSMKRAVLSGVRMAIVRLSREIAECGHRKALPDR